ncbi:MAG: glycogen debranching enzyme N-terminal domain-containing protein, partial [Lentisphaeria bacterium]|nr:glycogen debranching enzyme N-terminal domain-containing protein [Lentisphaeria bacterium]
YPADMRRQVMVPPQDALLVRSAHPFILDLTQKGATVFHAYSLPEKSGDGCFVLCAPPQNHSGEAENATLKLTVFTPEKVCHTEAEILLLPEPENTILHLDSSWKQAQEKQVFGSSDSGSYALFSADFGRVNSKYDALLAVNPNSEYPVDRHVVFNSCRAWLVINGYSHEINGTTLEKFTSHPGNRAKWFYSLPGIPGGRMGLEVDFRMALNADQVELRFKLKCEKSANHSCARLILRPDMEERVNHQLTRAIEGAEHTFVNSVKPVANGFDFTPYGNCFTCRLSKGEFHFAPEWRYMVDLPAERYYGLADKTDLFSPGFCTVELAAEEAVTMTFAAGEKREVIMPPEEIPATVDIDGIAAEAISRFIVRRDGLSTVIAGYPWFLDWGRDTLIALRGIVKFPEFAARAREILLRFAAFEKSGTIPNMICGGNDSNRDTSDAPLYLIVAVRDYIDATGDESIMEELCSGRTLKEVLTSIVANYCHGTPNGIIMDNESKLIFSPSHFSWMDTNFPAGTPREGYPIEIQSLWYAALNFLGETETADAVSLSIEKYFFSGGKVSDCLHCRPGTPAAAARRDDHVRSNMLLAITLDAVKDSGIKENILREGAKLLVPGAIRTLADEPVEYPLPIYHQGRLLNNPRHPYQGEYKGDEDTRRKAAYHNGTAWCWPFPAYCEALYRLGGEKSRKRALSLLMSAKKYFESGICGELPEVADGDLPHRSGGCPAQAWSITEFFRVKKILDGK